MNTDNAKILQQIPLNNTEILEKYIKDKYLFLETDTAVCSALMLNT